MRRTLRVLALCVFLIGITDVRSEEGSPAPGFFVFPVKTAFQRRIVNQNLTAVLYIDATQIMSSEGVDLENFPFQEIRARLRPYAKSDSKLQVSLYYPKFDLDRFQHDLLRYLIIGYCHDMGFGTVTAHSYRRNDGKPWSEFVKSVGNPDAEDGAEEEPEVTNGPVQGYVIKTNYSRLLASEADCAVFYQISEKNRASDERNIATENSIDEPIRKLITDMKLARKQKVCFYLSNGTNANQHELLGHFTKLAKDLGFEKAAVVFD